MSTMKFPCPQCGRQLELPADSTGRLAQCPACQATFRAGDTPVAPVSIEAEAEKPRPDHWQSNPDATSNPSTESHPFASPLESGMAAPAAINPYEPVYRSEPVAILNDIEIVPRTIEEVFSPTLSIFGARLGHLILAFIVVVVAGFVGFFAWVAVMIVADEIGGDLATGLGFLMLLPVLAFFASYLSVGIARNAIAVAQNKPSPIQELLPPLNVVIRFMVGGVVMTVVIGAASALVFGVFGVLANLANDQGVAATFVVISIFGVSLASMAAYWLLWAWVFIVSDGKATAIGAIRGAYALTMHNKLTSVLLVVIAVVLSTAGTSACYIGLLITQPLTNLMFAVAYLLMTNQVIHDPKVESQTPQPW